MDHPFTPGPWDFMRLQEDNKTDNRNDLVIIAPDPHDPQPWYVAEVYKNIGSGEPEEVEANARLLAAAPELLEALKPFAKFACDTPCGCNNCKARDAITKAVAGHL